jgi:hypothetical protein
MPALTPAQLRARSLERKGQLRHQRPPLPKPKDCPSAKTARLPDILAELAPGTNPEALSETVVGTDHLYFA